jgi:peroxiredoxin
MITLKKITLFLSMLVGFGAFAQEPSKESAEEPKKISNKLYEKLDAMKDANRKAFLNKPAPMFETKDINGNPVSLEALRGKVVVLNFWFTTCIACLEQQTSLMKVVEKFNGEKDVVFLALALEDKDQLKEHLTKHPFTYTIVPSSKDINKLYKASWFPTNIVISKDGTVKCFIEFDESETDTKTKKELIDAIVTELKNK